MSILDKILETKSSEVAKLLQNSSLAQLRERFDCKAAKPQRFIAALGSTPKPAVIAEIKRASPSKGLIREDLDPVSTAFEYAKAGAACLSILTDSEYFRGDNAYIPQVREALKENCPPILRKDFIIDKAQVWESANLGADAILLIVAALDSEKLIELYREATAAKLDVLIEIHNEEELAVVSEVYDRIKNPDRKLLLGINNRNLKTFECKLETFEGLAIKAKEQFGEDNILLVGESGIFTAEDAVTLDSYGAEAFLIGESLVAKGSPEENLVKLISAFRELKE